MSQGFHTLKEKIQYLLDKMDAGEKILSVEMDLLKAYCDALSKEIEQNGDELIKEFPLEASTEQKQPPKLEEAKEKINLREELEKDVEQEIEEEKHQEDVSETSNEPEPEVEEEVQDEPELELEEPKKVTDEPEEEPVDEVVNEPEEKPLVEPESTAPDEDYFEVTITRDDEEVSKEIEEPSKSNEEPAEAAKSEIEESVEEPSDNKEPEKEENYQFTHTREATEIKRESSVDPSEESEEDYGIGLKFKQSKPLGELIDLSEKYVFIQGLFNQDPDRFTKALRRMDEATSIDEALTILDDYVVGNDAELMQKLKAYLRIRFA